MDAFVATQFETIAAAAQGCDIIVAATALQIAARSVAEKMGIPYVFAAYCPTVLPSPHHAPPPLPPVPGQTPAPRNGRQPRALGSGCRTVQRHVRRRAQLPSGIRRPGPGQRRAQPHVHRPALARSRSHVWRPGPIPTDQAVFQTGAWILSDERPLSPELEAFLETGEPPVYFGFGSMRAPQDVSQVMIKTARALGRRAIVSRGWADLSLVDNEPDCLAIGEVNLQALFKRVAAVVHHGGAGTTTAAALAGAPQVVIPQMYDQHYWAQRIHHLGIGTAHAPGAPTTDSLTSALRHALQPDVAARARSIATPCAATAHRSPPGV